VKFFSTVVHHQCLLVSSHELESSLECLVEKHKSHSRGLHPYDLKMPPPNAITLEDRISTCGFWRNADIQSISRGTW
jgi:hypothetical protein